MPKPLSGRVAVVAGATRGAGRGIARMLGEAGATVYCTGRSSRVQPNGSSHVHAGRPETIEETAEMVTRDGGTGIPVRVDWRDALGNPQAAAMGCGGSQTPCFVGRAVAALAADAHVARKNGGICTTRVLSEEYGFNDVDGMRPDYAVFDAAIEQAKKTFLAPMVDAGRFTEVDWKLASKLEIPS